MLIKIMCCCCSLVAQSCPILCDPKDCSHGILSMGFSKQEYWSGCHFLLQEDNVLLIKTDIKE